MPKCECDFCVSYDKYRWATILECNCGCHKLDEVVGHDGLCCEFPNGKMKDNPYSLLEGAEYYRKLIQ